MSANSGGGSVKGALLAVTSGLLYIVLYERSGTRSLSALVLAFWLSIFAALELGIFITITENWQIPHDTAGGMMLIILALSTNVLALVFFQKGLQTCGGVMTSLLSTFEPITGLLIGLIIYHEALGVSSVIAVLCILSSVFILLKGTSADS